MSNCISLIQVAGIAANRRKVMETRKAFLEKEKVKEKGLQELQEKKMKKEKEKKESESELQTARKEGACEEADKENETRLVDELVFRVDSSLQSTMK